MNYQSVNIGSAPGALGADTIRGAFDKVNQNTTELHTALGDKFPAILQGTVIGHRWDGVTPGSGLPQADRIVNMSALQAAIDHASENRRFFELEPAFYEIEGPGPLVVPPNLPFVWRGQMGAAGYNATSIKKFGTLGAVGPILKLGGFNGQGCEALDFAGVALCYGTETAGDTSAQALLIGRHFMSRLEQIDITANWNGTGWDRPPYRGVRLDDGSGSVGYFSTIVRNLRVKGVQQNHLSARTVGTGNVFENIYLGNGGPNALAVAVGDSPFRWSDVAGAQYGNIINQLNIEWCKAGNLFRCDTTGGMVVNSLHLEGNHGTGYNPTLIHAVGSNVAFNGVDILHQRWLTTTGLDGNGTPSVFSSYGGSRIHVTALALQLDDASFIDRPWIMFRETDNSGDSFPLVTIDNCHVYGGTDAGTRSPDANMPAAQFGGWGAFRRYQNGPLFSTLHEAILDLTASTTIYGQYRDPIIRYPAALGANRTLTLSNKMKASGTGSTVTPPIGALATVRRRSGTGDSFTLTVAGHDGTTLATIAAGANGFFRFDGSAWSAL